MKHYKIGDIVSTETDRAQDLYGYQFYWNRWVPVTGKIRQIADFYEHRVCVEFELDYVKYYIWKSSKDVTSAKK